MEYLRGHDGAGGGDDGQEIMVEEELMTFAQVMAVSKSDPTKPSTTCNTERDPQCTVASKYASYLQFMADPFLVCM